MPGASNYNSEYDMQGELDVTKSKTKHKWSGRYKSTYKEMADTIKELSPFKRDLQKTGSHAQATILRKVRKKYGNDAVDMARGALSHYKKRKMGNK